MHAPTTEEDPVARGKRRRGRFGIAAALCLAVLSPLAIAGSAGAEAPAAPAPALPPPAAGDPAPAATEGGGIKINVNGSLSQAYAVSSGPTILGIPKAGTADYRVAAVQMRVAITPDDSFSIQLDHVRLGDSPAQAFESDLSVDWLFYEHRFGAAALRAGRVKIPFGIYNEVQEVGTLLPFYRASSDFYGIGSFATETVDGAAFSYSLDLGGGWQADADAYGGNWEFLSINSEVGLTKSKARSTLGGELWLTTPVRGLRVGAGGMHFKILTPGVPNTSSDIEHVSLEWDLGRVVTHVEYKLRHTGDAKAQAGYAHLGWRLLGRLTANAQYELSTLRIRELPTALHLDRDFALGLSYAVRPDLVLKLEHHWNKGYGVDAAPDFSQPAHSNRYAIASLAVSF
jgi:hypothetical protein